MKFAKDVKLKYRLAIERAARSIFKNGNKQQRNVARMAIESDLLIRFLPLDQIKVSGVTGLINNRLTNGRIRRESLSVKEALGEVHITFSDWCLDVAGQRGCQGTLVHEGLHAFDFARMISEFSNNRGKSENSSDITLYELERRAAFISADYLVRIGLPDYIDDGLKLSLVRLDDDGRPRIDAEGIENRLNNAYGLDESKPGPRLSDLLSIKPNSAGSGLSRFFGFWK